MMNLKTIDTMDTTDCNDADLVAQSLAGSREAFGRIVARYQSLICALSYSATGDLKQSEDLAQETFLSAWKDLGKLREPAKLRSWLCRISRHHTFDALKQQGREPSHAAETLDAAHDSPAPGPLPIEQAISKEEEEILWRSIARIPEIYREPLVLFYREHQSIEAVAQNLELSEDAVKQRLSRGRKLLHEQVLAFVEGALERTNPGKGFTLGVVDALPALGLSAKTASVGAAAAKSGAMGMFGAIFSPLLVVFGNYASYRMSMDGAGSDKERGYIKALFLKALVFTLGFSVVFAAPLFWACQNQKDSSTFWSLLINGVIVIYFVTLLAFVLWSLPARRRHLAGELAAKYAGRFPPAAYEYRSRSSLCGLPLLHIRIGDRFDVLRKPVKAWIAIGSSHAVGVLFASGGLAVAPVSFGGIAIGLLPFGAFAIGMVAIGACSLGMFANGGLAIGWQACGGGAMAWQAAAGGIATAFDFAVGNIAHAAQANNEIAQQFLRQNLFFRFSQIKSSHSILVLLLWVVPIALQGRIVARARRRQMENS
jgi:RNA polymerase sigma factor (sigma-70 family)